MNREKLDSRCDAVAERYSDKGYIIYSERYGEWTRKEAEAIALFLRKNLYSIVIDIIED